MKVVNESTVAKVEEPIVSIVVPIFNTPPDCLRRSISSVLNQTFSYFELILVDDGSKTECAQLCDEIARGDARARVIHQENKGFSGAMNKGIESSCGASLMFLDPDDEIMPYAIEHAIGCMERYGCDMVCGAWTRRFPGEDIEGRFNFKGEIAHLLSDEELDDFRVYALTALFPKKASTIFGADIGQGHVPKLFKKDVLSNVRLDEEMLWGSDTLMLADALSHCNRVALVDEVWYIYYMNDFSGTHSFTFDIDAHDRKVMQRRQDLFKGSTYDAACFVRCCATMACVSRNKGVASLPEITTRLKDKDVSELFERFDPDEYSLSRNQKIVLTCGKHRLFLLLALMFFAKTRLNLLKRKGLFGK